MNQSLIPEFRETISMQQHIGENHQDKVRELEGQCRIKEIKILKINYLKSMFLGLFLTLSVVGLLLLKYFNKLRVIVFYDLLPSSSIQSATHVYVKGHEASEEISEIRKIGYKQSVRKIFEFKKLRYELLGGQWLPLALPFAAEIEQCQSDDFLRRGLGRDQSRNRQRLYGRNQHRVEVPAYFQFLFDTMTQPLFLFQYFVSLIYALESFFSMALIMIFFGFFTTSINYILLLRSYKKIKQTAQKEFKVKVLRDGAFIQIENIELVPGDIYKPGQEIPCDSIVLRGEMFVDEVSLTGQNVPIAKFTLDGNNLYDKSNWLFEGSKVQTAKQNTLVMAVYVGYGSRRGRIIRKILNKTTKQPESFKKLIVFQIEVLIVSVIVFFMTLPRMYQFDIDGIMKVLRFFDFITYSFPAPYPILFNLSYSFCLMRMRNNGISGTDAEKTVEGSRLKTLCFDKTGTLTQNKMQVSNVYHIKSHNSVEEVTTRVNEYPTIADLFASCNSVETINREVKGDEIDLRLFQYTSSRLQESQVAGVIREVKVHGRTVQVLRINQYQSHFQSMSVLVRQPSSNKHIVYIKGSPQMIHKYSHRKFQGFEQFVKKLSFSGFRSIGFGYKQIRQDEVAEFMKADRQVFLRDTAILGVVTFINQLKPDAIQTLHKLTNAGINTKIITGDNIFLGVQTALMVGMISNDQTIIVVQGSKYNVITKSVEVLELRHNQRGQLIEEKKVVDNFHFSNHIDQVYAIDNDFIKMRPNDFLSEKVKVFARISPQNKALIVQRHRQRQQEVLDARKGLSKWLGDCSYKVGMVGDGANDLIAIKEADVGIGISSSDAVYSASFAISQLSQIVSIILQSKNTQRQIFQMTKYYGITQFLSIVNTVILTEDCSYFTSLELLYKNFINTLLITVFFSMSKPAQKLIKAIPNLNFLDLENHLIFWGNLIICTLGLVGGYAYYYNSDDFVANKEHRYCHFEDGWYGQTKSSTINFIAANIVYILLALILYKSKPWKQPIWKNKPLSITIAINTILIVVISCATESLSGLGIQPTAPLQILVVWLIVLTSGLACIAYNLVLQKLCFRSRLNPSQYSSISSSLQEFS